MSQLPKNFQFSPAQRSALQAYVATEVARSRGQMGPALNRPAGQGISKSARKRRRQAANRGGSVPQSAGGGIRMVGAPAAVSAVVTTGAPRIARGARSMRVQHRELVLASVAGSTGFTVQSFLALNPGVAATFPWLAPQAQQWEQYCCHRLKAEWIPIAPTSTQGDVILSPNYDASDPKPTTEAQAANNQGTIMAPCWQRSELLMDPSAMMGLGPRRFVRGAAVAGDVKTFDVGTLAVCSNNETGTSAIGKLYLEYDFEFFIPQNDPSVATAPLYTSRFTIASPQTFTTSVKAAVGFATVVNDPLNIGAPVSGVFTPPAGVYDIEVCLTARDSTAEAFNGSLEIWKNGAALAAPAQCAWNAASNAGSVEQVPMTIRAIVPCNGTDTFQIQADLVGAAGTLTAANADLLVRLA